MTILKSKKTYYTPLIGYASGYLNVGVVVPVLIECWTNTRNPLKKGLLHYVTLATKLFHIVLFHEDITRLEQKNSSPW